MLECLNLKNCGEGLGLEQLFFNKIIIQMIFGGNFKEG